MIFESVRYVFLTIAVSLPFSNTLSQDPACQVDSVPPYEIIISEIMADPLPPVVLPGNEYIEIFNRGAVSIRLIHWTVSVGSHNITIPDVSIAPGEYRIICDVAVDSLFSSYGSTIPVDPMPPVLNTGQVITLKTPSGHVIHSVSFSDAWYNDPGKDNGGWSLEMIDTDNPCGGRDNWLVSINETGGSPGHENSVKDHHPDVQSPMFLRATLPSDSTVLLYFSEPMDPCSLYSCKDYSVNNGYLHPQRAYPVEPEFSIVLLEYALPFRKNEQYAISVLSSLKDCAGNRIEGNAYSTFAVSETPSVNDIVISEVLFNPSGDHTEFIELYNRSEKVIDLSCLSISLADPSSYEIKKSIDLADYPFLLFPGQYVAITPDAYTLGKEFRIHLPSVMELPSLFSLPDQKGLIVITDEDDQPMDEFHYDESMHQAMIHETEGISLERINPDLPSSDPGNWHSASTSSGYATPGIQNSQATNPDESWNITLSSEVLSPDGDGIDDHVILRLQLGEPGWMGTIAIYDMQGHPVISLVNNSLLGTDEYLVWDGRTQDGRMVEIGLYLIYGKIFSQEGKSKNFKKVIPVVRK